MATVAGAQSNRQSKHACPRTAFDSLTRTLIVAANEGVRLDASLLLD